MREVLTAASRALQTLATVRITLKLIERLVRRKGSNAPVNEKESVTMKEWKKKNKKDESSVKSSDVQFYLYCHALYLEVRAAALNLNKSLQPLMDEVGSEALLPKSVAEDLGQTRVVLTDCLPIIDSRIRRSYVMAIEDMQTTICSRF
ncbi:unnamed protein product [Caenorhabditis bovis]|uniref:Uncharacterized protein n=1 Tax=Caenorhabditis bovis TaxID=2654633 RepID=A0A8S1EFT2_9PELO|nr:unnamed protein product [Caenorhabditis bovis]